MDKYTEDLIINYLARYFEYWRRIIIPKIYFKNEGEIDLLIVNQSGYYWNIEIKTSISDLKADFKKTERWSNEKNYIGKARLFYFIFPKSILKDNKIPEWMPKNIGLMALYEIENSTRGILLEQIQSPKVNKKACKLSADDYIELSKKASSKYFNLKYKILEKEIENG